MKIFSSNKSLDSMFSRLESLNPITGNIFYDNLPNNAFLKKPRIGTLVLQSKEITADTSSVMRQGSSPAMSALGATTAFSAFQGLFSLEHACHAYQSADQLHDENGKWISISDIALRVAQCFGGIAFGLVRSADIAIRGFSSFNFLEKPALHATAIGTYCFGVLYVCILALSSISIKETHGFLKTLENSKVNVEELSSLLGEITGKGVPSFSRDLSKKDVYVHLGMELRSMVKEIDPKLGREFSDKKLGKALFTNRYNKFLPTVLHRVGASFSNRDITVNQLKKDKGLIQVIWAREKQAVFERILGFKGMEFVQKASEMNLYGLLSNEKTKAYAQEVSKGLIQDLEKCSKKQKQTMVSYFFAGALGTIFTGLSITAAASMPALMLVCDIGFLAVSLMMGYGDFQCFLETYKAGGPIGEYAKPYVLLHFVLGVAAIATAATLTTLSGGTFPLISLFIIGSVWMASGIGMMILLEKRGKSYDVEHPTLANFAQQVGSSKLSILYKESLEMFSKLPKLQREAILKRLLQDYKHLQLYANGLDTFSPLLSKETVEGKRKRIYKKLKGDKLVKESFELANKKLLASSHPLTEESLSKHPCSHIFYKTFYDKLAKSEQEKFIARAGKVKLLEVITKLLDKNLKVQNTEKVAQDNLLLRFAG
jgi:hypothetical protein